ncbi:hypothetical protein NQ318_012594 [Aromia moschata]|uniref:Protein turtle n=1 Tax=Aromia moschata TaxID=1265417 RepID=A0AAV8YM99_9CUCU|nr:hypothetical protein NQ318_012594 [Aromia moschata]
MFIGARGVIWYVAIAYTFVNCYYFEESNVPKYLTAAVGDYIVFNCEVDFPQSFPIPYKVVWRRGDELIFSYSWEDSVVTESDDYVGRINLLNKPQQIYGRASINLTSIRESDAGWFECRVIFPNRTPPWRNNGTWFHLTVSGGNLLAIPPINKTVLEGEEVEFACLPKDFSIKIRWFKDGIPLTEYHDLMTRSWVTKENTLVIRPCDSGDYGEYECEASTSEGEQQTAKAFLNAKVMYAPPEIHLPFGRPALIDCHFRANPPLTNLRWEKDGFLFDPYNIQGGILQAQRQPILQQGGRVAQRDVHLHALQRSGDRRALAQHARHRAEASGVHTDAAQPVPEEAGGDDRDAVRRQRWRQRAQAYYYLKDGASLPMGRYSIKDGNLTIIDIQAEDRGIYQCSATNKAATITAETELLVENVPSSAPYNITAVSSTTSVHLTWLIGRQRANIDFSIWYKRTDVSEWKTYQVPSSKVLEATITTLTPGTEYEFMVLCKDDEGEGLFSKSVRVWTKTIEGGESERFRGPFPPVGYPRNVTVYPTDVGLLVTWQPPEYGLENLRRYVVRWSQGPDDFIFKAADTRNTSYLRNGRV